MANTHTDLHDVLDALAQIASQKALAHFRAPGLDAANKAKGALFDPVTEADTSVEKALRAELAKRRPKDGILGEEFDAVPSSSGITWVIDPIDGTRAFLAGAPTWGTLVAARSEDQVIAAMIVQPYIGEVFKAVGGQATLTHGSKTTPIATRDCAALGDAILLSTFPEIGSGIERLSFQRVAKQVKLTRYGLDCYGYALLAMGQVDLVIEAGLNPYDIQGPIGVIEAAGGVVTDWNGDPALEGGRVIAAGDARLHKIALDVLNSGL